MLVGEPVSERPELVPGVAVDRPIRLTDVARRTTAENVAPGISARARHNGRWRAQQVVVLGDGAKWIGNLAEKPFSRGHASGGRRACARAVFAALPEGRDSWAQAVIDHLFEGQVEPVMAALETLPARAPEPGKMRSILETEADSFRSNRHWMRSPAFRSPGMHLGCGIAEAACTTVVATRAKRSGMRWTPQGLDAILALRTAALNQEFDHCWQACREAI